MAKSGVFISIVADASGSVKGFKQAENAATRFGKRITATGQSMSRFGGTLTKSVTLPLVAFGVSSVKAYLDSEEALNTLQTALKKSPKLARENVKGFTDLASALQKKTAADDESIIKGQANLALFDLTGDQIKRLTPLVVDYARRTKTAVPEAATLIGKALMGNARALKSLGINFKATGDRGRDFATIFALLQNKVGGFAEAEGKTASGRLQIMKNRFNDLQEVVGQKLLPIGTRLLAFASGLLDRFSRLSPKTQDTIIKFGVLAAVAGPVLKIVGGLVSGVGKLISGFSALVGGISSLVARFIPATAATSGLAAAETRLAAANTAVAASGAGVLSFLTKLAGLAGAAYAIGTIPTGNQAYNIGNPKSRNYIPPGPTYKFKSKAEANAYAQKHPGGTVYEDLSSSGKHQGWAVYYSSGGAAPDDAHRQHGGRAHSGGLIMHGGGMVPKADERLALLQAGEFVMRRAAVRRIGAGPLAAANAGGAFGNVTINLHVPNGAGMTERQYAERIGALIAQQFRRMGRKF